LTQQAGNDSDSKSYSTSISSRRFTLTGNYTRASGNSLLTNAGLVTIAPTPGIPESNLILFSGDSYGGGLSATPLSSSTNSHNNEELFNAQVQYHLRRIGLLAGYTRFTQGISATGLPPGTSNSYFAGVSRWFDFF
jgi:hypothetical protein